MSQLACVIVPDPDAQRVLDLYQRFQDAKLAYNTVSDEMTAKYLPGGYVVLSPTKGGLRVQVWPKP